MIKGKFRVVDDFYGANYNVNQKPLTRLRRTVHHFRAGAAARRLRQSEDQETRQRSAYHLQERLGELRGLPQKVGQILSMSDSTAAEALQPLQNGGPALPLAELLGTLREAWGADPSTLCAQIEPQGLAASLGQVHRGVLVDGTEVAIKIRYPGIEQAIDADLRALGWLSIPFGGLKNGFDMDGYREVLRAGLQEELDYCTEARHQHAIGVAAQGLPLVVPEVVEDLSCGHVLTSRWESGETLADARGWSPGERAALGSTLVRNFLALTFDHGLVHADPHPGNYAFRRTARGPEVVLYDHGCVQRLSHRDRMLILRLLRGAAQRSATEDPYPLLVELGFDADLLRPLREKLPALCAILFEPFAAQGAFDMSGWERSARASGVLGEDRLNFRAAGSPRLIYFLRAFEGLCFYLRELDQPVWWSKTLAPLLDRHSENMQRLELQEPVDPNATYGCLARSLEIQVLEGRRPKAQLKLPAGAVERLEQFIDDELRSKIEEHDISLEELVAQVRANGYAPQEIFSLAEGSRSIEVRLS